MKYNLNSLGLSYNEIGDTGAEALAGSSHLFGLTVLSLSENDIGDSIDLLKKRFWKAVNL